jgi:hypothetical protein
MKKHLLPLLLAGFTLQSANAASYLIDNFDTDTSANYTTYKLLDQGAGTTNVSLVISGGTASNTSSGTTGAEQSLHLNNTTISLAVGESLVGFTPTVSGSGNDFGIVIATTPSSSLGNPVAGDVRSGMNFLFISFRSPTQLNSRGYAGGTIEVAQAQAFSVDPDSLYIERTDTNTFDFGYFTGLTKTSMVVRNVADGSVFNRVGFYSDLRADGVGYNGFDSLNVIPEPSAALLGGLGLLDLLRRRRA